MLSAFVEFLHFTYIHFSSSTIACKHACMFISIKTIFLRCFKIQANRFKNGFGTVFLVVVNAIGTTHFQVLELIELNRTMLEFSTADNSSIINEYIGIVNPMAGALFLSGLTNTSYHFLPLEKCARPQKNPIKYGHYYITFYKHCKYFFYIVQVCTRTHTFTFSNCFSNECSDRHIGKGLT